MILDHERLRLSTMLCERFNPLYAILDSAQIPDVAERLQLKRHTAAKLPDLQGNSDAVQITSLFEGREAIELFDVAPLLIKMGESRATLEKFLEDGWGLSWGIYLSSALPFSELAAHLRRFTKIETEDGKLMFFRYYDPRVLRLYLPTCSPAERREFFGDGPGIRDFIAESENPSTALVFRWDGSQEQVCV